MGLLSYNRPASSPVFIQASHSVDFLFAITNTPEPIPFDTNDELEGGISHPTGAGNTEFEVTTPNSEVFVIAAQPQLLANAAGRFHMFLQKDTGGGFVDVANSNVELVLANNAADVIPLILTTRLQPGDKIRVMGSVTNTDIILEAPPVAGEPAIPAIIFTMYKI